MYWNMGGGGDVGLMIWWAEGIIHKVLLKSANKTFQSLVSRFQNSRFQIVPFISFSTLHKSQRAGKRE